MIGLIGYAVLDSITNWLPLIIVCVISLSACGALIARLLEPRFIRNSKLLRTLLDTSLFWIGIRLLGTVLSICIYLKLGPEWLWSEDTGGLVLFNLATVLFVFFFLAGLLLPLLLEYGLVEFIGSQLHRVLKPLYRIPGSSGVDIIASLLGDGTIGTLITSRQYEKGYYTAREAAIVASTFSIVSISFCVVVVNFINLSHIFPYFYLTVISTCLLIALILPRIWPLSRISDSFHKQADPHIVKQHDNNRQGRAVESGLQLALKKAENSPGINQLLQKGMINALDIWFVFMPIIVTISTIGLVLSHTTPIFQWLGSPLVPVLELMGVPEAAKAASAMFLGFADMFLPIALSVDIQSEMTRFIIAALSVAQLIYMSEVGVLIMRSSIPLSFINLLSIFLIRTVLALPIIVLFAHCYF